MIQEKQNLKSLEQIAERLSKMFNINFIRNHSKQPYCNSISYIIIESQYVVIKILDQKVEFYISVDNNTLNIGTKIKDLSTIENILKFLDNTTDAFKEFVVIADIYDAKYLATGNKLISYFQILQWHKNLKTYNAKYQIEIMSNLNSFLRIKSKK